MKIVTGRLRLTEQFQNSVTRRFSMTLTANITSEIMTAKLEST